MNSGKTFRESSIDTVKNLVKNQTPVGSDYFSFFVEGKSVFSKTNQWDETCLIAKRLMIIQLEMTIHLNGPCSHTTFLI